MLINIVTLGCSKNSVDSEVMASRFAELGHQLCFEEEKDSDVVLVNTCSFIQDAKEESIEEIFLQVERKKEGRVKKVYVMGCLAQRYKDELLEAIPEVDGFYTFAELPRLMESLDFDLLGHQGRVLSTPAHYAYMKISEGCDRSCAFCAIPLIRGKQVSKPIEQLYDEAQMLVSKGVKELILIAQDLTAYGTDNYKERRLEQLMKKLADVKGLEWIRLHYAYPNSFPYPILDVMREHSQFCRYLDIPLQHAAENVLRGMNRPSTLEKMYQFMDTLRTKVPGIAIRTTLLSGFPTETKADHNALVQFVKDMCFDRMGVFSYSPEEGTPAYQLGDPISKKEKEKRRNELMAIQEEISLAINESKEGQTMKVLIDTEEDDCFIGRTEFDSPEVDNAVLVEKHPDIKVGHFYPVLITGAEAYDLTAQLIEE